MREDLEKENRLLRSKVRILEADIQQRTIELNVMTNDRDFHMQQLQMFLDKENDEK